MGSKPASKEDTSEIEAPVQGLGRLFPIMAGISLITALTAVAMGGIVRVTGSGLGCPDWPLCHGNIIPPWELAPWLEYLHRLSVVVFSVFILLMVVTAYMSYRTPNRTFYLALSSAGLLVAQAVLGAYTVLSELHHAIALVHTGVATGLVGMLAMITAGAVRPRWLSEGIRQGEQLDSFRWLMLTLGFAAFVLILSGAYVTRTNGAPFACTQVPLCGTPVGDMVDIQWIHMAHRVIGFLVGLLMLLVILRSKALQHVGIMIMTGLMAALLGV
ncbi:MAG: COX15/CtaA family protein, partial [Dehalococcoidia bacterium]|nr:COX15/CtaA family protein [Dehalococcoidia bacterium]